MTQDEVYRTAIRDVENVAREQTLREAANNMRARRLAEQLMRDAARHDDGREDIATMHSDRAQAFTEAEKALLALVPPPPQGDSR